MKFFVKVSLKVSVPFCITMRIRVHDRADPSSTHVLLLLLLLIMMMMMMHHGHVTTGRQSPLNMNTRLTASLSSHHHLVSNEWSNVEAHMAM